MANARAHAVGAATTVGIGLWLEEQARGVNTATPYVGTGLAAFMGSLPDLMEPAHHPHHRQFFHGVTFAVGLGYGLYRLYRWTPEEDWERLLRFVGLVAGGAYLTHLAMDATTAHSIPLLGKLS
ncbi:MAG: metal-dependent hydrolase [bacterium]|nr:metal-dependent hydrolase [bacterium]